jgi:hypothetical protein
MPGPLCAGNLWKTRQEIVYIGLIALMNSPVILIAAYALLH